jgi:hypothetical protein
LYLPVLIKVLNIVPKYLKTIFFIYLVYYFKLLHNSYVNMDFLFQQNILSHKDWRFYCIIDTLQCTRCGFSSTVRNWQGKLKNAILNAFLIFATFDHPANLYWWRNDCNLFETIKPQFCKCHRQYQNSLYIEMVSWFCYAAYNSPKFNGFMKCTL